MIAPTGLMTSVPQDAAAKNGAVPSAEVARSTIQMKPKALYLMEEKTLQTVYGAEERDLIAGFLEVDPVPYDRQSIHNIFDRLKDVEIVMASWGTPVLDAAFLEAAPNLRAFFYAAGSVKHFTTPEFWKRGVTICSAYATNAEPVAEYTLGVILLSLKRFWSFAHSVRTETDPWDDHNRVVPGVYKSTVGLISCGMIARRLIQLLKPFDVRCVVYDPYVTESEMKELGVELCSLHEIFERSDVISIHTPLLPETRGMIRGKMVEAMKPGATLINTARGGVIQQDEIAEVLSQRADLTAVLDVLDVEPPARGTPLIQLPNVWVTPHIAGSLGPECRRLGRAMVEELGRYLAGEPLLWKITEEFAARLA
jgi:phosphoglycerate dehydrogenase-like enzyme